MFMVNVAWGFAVLALIWSCEILLANAEITLSSLRVENHVAPVETVIKPLFSWTLVSPEREATQTSYHILVSKSLIGGSDVWNSGVIASNKTHLIQYPSCEFTPNTHYFWGVNVSTSAGSGFATSEFVTGLPTSSDSDSSSWVGKRAEQLPTALVEAFQSASWIWTAETDPQNIPAEDRAFRYTFTAPPGEMTPSALVLLSVDNQFSLYINGKLIGESPSERDSWTQAYVYSVTLTSDVNVIAIRGTNSDGNPSPAGVLAAIQITFSNGTTSFLSSDASWRSAKTIPDGFESPSFNDSSWLPAVVLFKYGGGPWGSQVKLPTPPSHKTTSSTTPSSSPTAPKSNTAATPTPTPDIAGKTTGPDVGAIVGGVLGGIIFLLLVLIAYLWRKKPGKPSPPEQLILHPLDLEFGGRASRQSMSQHVPLPSSSLRYFPSISPSMSISAVAQRNRNKANGTQAQGQHTGGSTDIETRTRLRRLEELVLALDQEIASGGGNSLRVAELRERVADLTRQGKGIAPAGDNKSLGLMVINT